MQLHMIVSHYPNNTLKINKELNLNKIKIIN